MLFDREQLQAHERAVLAPYATFSDASRGRAHPEPEVLGRTPFHEDRERVLHTAAFRRLQYKTQVFVNFEGDHYRTRLTHTLEVASVARNVSVSLGLNETLAETITLAHDLGHSPFGHAGERALNELMREHGGFEHNRQSVRVVTKLEERSSAHPGLNLTWETLEGLAKHEPLAEGDRTVGRPSLEAQLANVADSVAYNAHDLDDGLRSGLISPRDLRDVELWMYLVRRLGVDERDFGDRERRAVTRELLRWMTDDLIRESNRRLEDAGVHSPEDARSHPATLVCHSREARDLLADLGRFLFTHLYRHHQVVRQIHQAELILGALFDAYRARPALLPPNVRAREATSGLERTVCDYLAGMTDRFATDEYRRLFQPRAW
ncbi:deoxyguanosinetriphosphate triphosphohydrolase [Deinococcus yavapaiensis]|uniref:Deoxyguanosinetriphosphate triphosphohydrolase-like protein n=1 Tax=Deinococcus yavapaiensis KR-236 TaxID=694435 RepID=A0A318S2Q2_9DEIO|nr:deoxyguanosinetriphosphate triphosphohydrolase [Deinococcus yavapaiensis]PYE52811.1 dGTPase [Deinococcus yavapaiensis KR-236]